MASKVLVIFSHPTLEHSKVNKRLLLEAQKHPEVEVDDLYELYPDFHIDVKWEQQRIQHFQALVFQHPIYWYSCPSLMKEWIDLVLAYNFAYGPEGSAMAGKAWVSAVSAGSSIESYDVQGLHEQPLSGFLKPFELTAKLCRMQYQQPWIVHNAHKLTATELDEEARCYRQRLDELVHSLSDS